MTTQQITLRKAPTCALTAPPCTDMTPPPPMAPTMLGTLHVRETVKKKLHEQHCAGETFTPAEAQSLPPECPLRPLAEAQSPLHAPAEASSTLYAPCCLWLRPRAPCMPPACPMLAPAEAHSPLQALLPKVRAELQVAGNLTHGEFSVCILLAPQCLQLVSALSQPCLGLAPLPLYPYPYPHPRKHYR